VYAYRFALPSLYGIGQPPTRRLSSDLVSPVCCRVTVGHVTAAVFEQCARVLVTSQVRRCWIKIDSAVNFRGKSSSVFMQCRLWVIRLTKTVSRSAVLFATLWDCRELSDDTLATVSESSGCYDNNWRRPSPTVRRPSYDASSPFRRCRLARCVLTCETLAAAASYYCWWHSRSLYYVRVPPFPFCTCLYFSLNTVLSVTTALHLLLKSYSVTEAVCW